MFEEVERPSDYPREVFTAGVVLPEQLYLYARYLARDKVNPPYHRLISATGFDSAVLGKEETYIHGFGTHGDIAAPESAAAFTIETVFSLGNTHIKKGTKGYFGRTYAQAIVSAMAQSGVNTRLDDTYGEFFTYAHASMNNVHAEINLGFPNEMSESAYASNPAHVAWSSDQFAEASHMLPFRMPFMQRDGANRYIRMYLVSEDHIARDSETFPALESKAAVMRAFYMYPLLLSNVVKALYAVEGQTPPARPVRLRPTIFE